MPQLLTLPFLQHPDALRVKDIYHILAGEGHQLLIVGGAVRDWLMNAEPKDLDLVTTATPEELERLFPQTVPVGKAFGVMLVIQDQKPFEVATLRTEGRYLDGRHPEKVAWGTIDQDVHRRDFTINSIYYDPFKNLVYDLVGGLKDLQEKLIRAVGDPQKRFAEDHLRILRAYRLRGQTGFTFGPKLRLALSQSAALVRDVSGERRREELTRLFNSPQRELVIPELVEDQVLENLFPGFTFELKAYERLEDSSVRLLELFLWILHSNDLGTNKVDAVAWKNLSESLKLSRDEKRDLAEALIFWRDPEAVQRMELSEVVLRLWHPAFAVGLSEFLRRHPNDEWNQKALEARKIQARWGARPPEMWMRAADFPDLKGVELGARLKEVYKEQILSAAANREEFLKWKSPKA